MKNGAAAVGFILFIVLFVQFAPTLFSNGWFLAGMVVPAGIVGVLYFVRPKCERCGSRSSGYRHQRIDGGPDLRYSSNPIECKSCGRER
jgi:hypothetical protein